MIKIEVNTEDNKKVYCSCEVNIEATKSVAIAEFMAVLDGLCMSDKLILMLAINDFLRDYDND